MRLQLRFKFSFVSNAGHAQVPPSLSAHRSLEGGCFTDMHEKRKLEPREDQRGSCRPLICGRGAH
jgi:hypothetical protein